MAAERKIRPYNLVAELTYKCPLQCPYCSNPTNYGETFRDELSTEDWARVFKEAASLGVMQVGLSGGEPGARKDLPEITKAAIDAGLYAHLVTAGTVFTKAKLSRLKEVGMDSVQLSVQDSDPANSDLIAGVPSFAKKMEFAEWCRELELPLTLNVVLHRLNLDHIAEIVALAKEIGAHRLEMANTQYYAWALENRDMLIPTREQLEGARAAAKQAREDNPAMEILFVIPDYYADTPKPCMGGWASQVILIQPTGKMLPCHAAEIIPGITFDSVRDKSVQEIWLHSESFNKFRGTDWMPEPCRGCDRKEIDFGGCRCQAMMLTGDPTNADPTCHLSLHHDIIVKAREAANRPRRPEDLIFRTWPPRGLGMTQAQPIPMHMNGKPSM
jgi:pyrroloquinoline quinone biosynthesis protein E